MTREIVESHFNVWGCPWDSISETLGSEGVKGYFINRLLGSIESNLGDLSVPFLLEPPFGVFFFIFLCTEQVSQNDSKKRLPGGPQEGSRLDGSSIFTFAAEPKKGSNMGAKMERFGSQGHHYTPFCSPMSRK